MIEIHNFCHQYGCIKFQIQMSEQKMIPELYTYNHQIDFNMSGASGNWCTLIPSKKLQGVPLVAQLGNWLNFI